MDLVCSFGRIIKMTVWQYEVGNRIAPGSRAMIVAKFLFIAIWLAMPPTKYGREKVGWSTGELLDKNSQQHFVSYPLPYLVGGIANQIAIKRNLATIIALLPGAILFIVLNFYVAIFVVATAATPMKYSGCRIFPKLWYFSIISMKFLDSKIPQLFAFLKISQYFLVRI